MSASFPVVDAISGWSIAPDTPPPLAAYPQPIFSATLLDEITNLPPDPPLAASTSTVGVQALAATSGMAGLSCIPLTRFSAGGITGTSLQLSLNGPGYIPISLTGALGAQPGFPQSFTPASAGLVMLHRAPISLTGQVTDSTQAPLFTAEVSVDGIWTTMASLQSAAAAPNLIAVLSPLYAARDTTATVAAQTLTPLAPAKTLLNPGNVGDPSLRLSDQVGLVPGSIIALDQQDPQRGEYVTVTAITLAGLTPQQPATAVLAYPLARPHASGAVATPMQPTSTGTANNLAQPAQIGDVTLFPASMTGLDTNMSAIVITGGGAPSPEFHAASLYATTSDINGHAVLPPIHRLAQVTLRVHHPSQTTDLLSTVSLPFGAAALALNLAFA